MRIVHILNEVVSTGNGICNATVDLACTQSQAGHQVSVVSSGGGYIDLLARYNVPHHTVYLRPRSLRLWYDVPRLRSIIRSIQPDIVHAHTMAAAVLMNLGRAFGGFGDYGLVTTVHNEWRRSSNLMRLGDYLIVLSDNGRNSFVKRGVPEHRLKVVPHGILHSPRWFNDIEVDKRVIEQSGVGQVIITTAGLYIRKGIGELIQAFGQIADEFPNASLLILGWGPDQKMFEQQIDSVKGGERIQLKGFVAKPRPILSQAAVFVLASYTETFPLAVAEAREAGCAIVASKVGGVPDLLEHGRAGLLIPPRNADAVAEALRRLLGDPNELAYWRQAARSNLEWFSCERMEKETTNVYVSLLRERSDQRKPTESVAKY